MIKNLWTDHASLLADAYVRGAGTVRFEVVTRALMTHLPPAPQRVLDVGGGFGRQAIMLARLGHSVVVVDCDPKMLAIAQDALMSEPEAVRSRVELVHSDGENVASMAGGGFDLVCCHSVLMYQEDPVPMLCALVRSVRRGGLLSILSLNTDARAMRFGLQGRWREAISHLQEGAPMDVQHVPIREHTREDVTTILEAAGAVVKEWHGVGIFTDHITDKIIVDDPEEIYLAEWLAGRRDPYRQVARCFHLLAERV